MNDQTKVRGTVPDLSAVAGNALGAVDSPDSGGQRGEFAGRYYGVRRNSDLHGNLPVAVFYQEKSLVAGLTEYARRYASAQMRQMDELLVPYAVVDETGRLVWMNQEFSRITETEGAAPKTLMSVFPQVTKEQLQTAGETITVHDSYGERNYRIDLRQLEMDPQEEEPMEGPRQTLTAVCLSDETQILKYRQQINDQKMVAGLIYLDNYDEALESVEEVRRSLLIALIDRKINKYISSMNGIVKKLEKDKYFFAVKQQYMLKIQEDHFSILEEVKTVNIGNEMARDFKYRNRNER